jgi:hypothetical protein
VGSQFNHNSASAGGNAFGYSFGVDTRTARFDQRVSWDDTVLRMVNVSDNPLFNIHEVNVNVLVDANADTPSSTAHAFADPIISIEPAFAAAHPEFKLVLAAMSGPSLSRAAGPCGSPVRR